jgi:PqqD family protein of HPr-rel-A system
VAQDHDALRLSGRCWRVGDAAARHWRSWGDEVVVYHEPSASTLLLPADAATVFLTLCDAGPEGLDEDALGEQLGDGAPDEQRRQHLRDILDSLRTRWLAECRAP